jgi:hypothetical protein
MLLLLLLLITPAQSFDFGKTLFRQKKTREMLMILKRPADKHWAWNQENCRIQRFQLAAMREKVPVHRKPGSNILPFD